MCQSQRKAETILQQLGICHRKSLIKNHERGAGAACCVNAKNPSPLPTWEWAGISRVSCAGNIRPCETAHYTPKNFHTKALLHRHQSHCHQRQKVRRLASKFVTHLFPRVWIARALIRVVLIRGIWKARYTEHRCNLKVLCHKDSVWRLAGCGYNET